MLKISVLTTETSVRSGKNKSGNEYRMVSQPIWVHLSGKPFPTESKVLLQDGQPPYPQGDYTLHDTSYVVGQYDRLELNPVLIPLQQQSKQAS